MWTMISPLLMQCHLFVRIITRLLPWCRCRPPGLSLLPSLTGSLFEFFVFRLLLRLQDVINLRFEGVMNGLHLFHLLILGNRRILADGSDFLPLLYEDRFESGFLVFCQVKLFAKPAQVCCDAVGAVPIASSPATLSDCQPTKTA